MAIRVGIELSPRTCRIVEVEVGSAGRTAPGETRVLSFATLPAGSPELPLRLAALRARAAAVVAWGALNDNRVVTVADGRRRAMRAEASAQFSRSQAGGRIDLGRVLAEVAPVGPRVAGSPSRQVMLAVADADAVRDALRPLAASGLRPQTLVTPALALRSLAWTRRAAGVPGLAEAYVALDETAASAAILRDGVLLASRDMGWGYLEERKGRLEVRPRQDVAARLAGDLDELFRAVRGPVSQISICGGLHDLRSTMVPLMERLDVEVETLDSLFGIDPLRLPDPAGEFRDHASELRLAWAVAVDEQAPINLLRPEQERASARRLVRVAAAAGVAAGIGAAWAAGRSGAWRLLAPTPAPVTVARAVVPAAGSAGWRPEPARPVPPAAPEVPRQVASGARPPPPAPAPPAESQPRVPVPARRPPAPAPERVRPSAGQPAAPVPAPARVLEEPAGVAPSRARTEIATAGLEAEVDTILYGPDRKLAIVDGRIVQTGDTIRGGRIVEITPSAVIVVEAGGRVQQLTLSRSNP